jgi:hypothetical protein
VYVIWRKKIINHENQLETRSMVPCIWPALFFPLFRRPSPSLLRTGAGGRCQPWPRDLPHPPRLRRRQRSKSKSHAQPARGVLPALGIYRRDEVKALFRSNFKTRRLFFHLPLVFSYFFHLCQQALTCLFAWQERPTENLIRSRGIYLVILIFRSLLSPINYQISICI